MRILIVEDERPIAEYIESMTRECLPDVPLSIRVCFDLEDAVEHLFSQPIDLCLLDLNLHGDDGFRLLEHAAAGSFHTIVISANTDRALEAFRYGVLDFVPKPFDRTRLAEALARLERAHSAHRAMELLAVKVGGAVRLHPLDDVQYFLASGNYVEAHLAGGKCELVEKTMRQLEQILPPNFERTHRSYLVDVRRIAWFGHVAGGRYELRLRDGQVLPLSRDRVRVLKERVHIGSDPT